jgi:hypothetical protein
MIAIKKSSTLFVYLGIAIISSLLLVSCQNESSEKTAQEKETAKKEISDIGKGIIQSVERLDIESALKPYLDSPDFLMINPDGSYQDYADFKSANTEAFKQLTSMKQTNIKEEFRFLSKTEVLYTWFGKNEIELKTGEKIKNESYIGTMLFSKINNEWRIVYAHESASPAIQEQVKK